eukprot:TRINITY_DN4937_c0_g1_i1.p1 TRINITY_DN4937_c0_g1~~TRINITY_DN4937_c0_g1_i1.p1  ORF type:complete len:698 (-),score=120.52 TRINITY_DN4937_c0_g1_i1:1439-3373(-)
MAIRRQSSFQRAGGLTAVACLFAVLALFAPAQVRAGDADILLQFQAELNATMPRWTAANINNLCVDWSGVSCNGAGRVTQLNLNPDAGAPRLSGRISPAMAGLTSLETFNAPNQNLWGPFPKEIFQFPNISSINLKGTPVTIEWPATASSALNEMNLDGTNITAPISDAFAWNTLASMDLRRTEVKCPLPQGLVNRWSQSVNSPILYATYTMFEIMNNRLCNQIDMTLIPVAVASVYGIKSTPNPALTFTAVHKNIQLEFYDHEIKIFGVFKNGTVWREDFFSLNIPALAPWDRTRQARMRPFAVTPFKSIGWTVPQTQLTATATLTNVFNQVMETSLIFEFDRDDGNIIVNGASLKFSYTARNINVTFPGISNLQFHMVAGYHTQLSEPGSPPIFCGDFIGQQVACESSTANVTFALEVGGLNTFSSARIGVRNTKIDLSFSYGLNGTRDGVDLWAQPHPTDVGAERYWVKQGLSDFTDKFHKLGLSHLLPPSPPAREQAMQLVVTLDMFPFNDSLIYDPDISLSLIFDTSSDFPPASSPLTSGAFANVSNNDVAIVAGVVAAIIVAAAVIVAAVLWHRRRSANLRARDTIARRLGTSVKDEPASPAEPQAQQSQADREKEDRKNRKWKKSTLRAVRVTNIAE